MSRIYEAIRRAEESRSKSKITSGDGLGVMELPEQKILTLEPHGLNASDILQVVEFCKRHDLELHVSPRSQHYSCSLKRALSIT
jgi:hypothetical protein